jgi:tetratricopeptide (TPR) repeat protein
LYLFNLQHPQRALEYFEKSLKSDPKNVDALYGKGVALHYLGRYVESNLVLDRVLPDGDARLTSDAVELRSYHIGQASYFTAYNYYLLGMYPEARERATEAQRWQPGSKNVSFISGLLYLTEGKPIEAKGEFLSVIDGGTNLCDAYKHLGNLELPEEPKVMDRFLDCGTCLLQNYQKAVEELSELERKDIDPITKEEIRKTHLKNIETIRENALETIAEITEITLREIQHPNQQFWNSLNNLKLVLSNPKSSQIR